MHIHNPTHSVTHHMQISVVQQEEVTLTKPELVHGIIA